MTKVIIQHGKLLEPFFNFYVKNSPDVKGSGWKEWVPPDKEKVEKRIQTYRDIWAKYEEKILNGACSALNLSFDRDIIDVFVVAGLNRSMSNPIIIKSGYSPKNFIIAITHELAHRLLASNKNLFNINNSFLFVKGDNDTINSHILIFAVLRKIFKDEPEMLKIISDIKYDENYKKAYELSENYEAILKFFRDKLRLL